MKQTIIKTLLCVVALALAVPAIAASPKERTGKAVRIKGGVRYSTDNGKVWQPLKVGTSSFVLSARVVSLHGSEVYARGTSRLVRLDPHTFRPAPWSDRFRRAFEPLLPKP